MLGGVDLAFLTCRFFNTAARNAESSFSEWSGCLVDQAAPNKSNKIRTTSTAAQPFIDTPGLRFYAASQVFLLASTFCRRAIAWMTLNICRCVCFGGFSSSNDGKK